MLGAFANAGQYAATQYVDDNCITLGGMAWNAGLGDLGGRISGAFKPRGMPYSTDILPWMQRGTHELHRALNDRRLIDAAYRAAMGSVANGSATTIGGNPTFWDVARAKWRDIFQ